ncbi:MAG: nucleotide-binding protein [Nitrospirae bacterium]|nr:nucleotide-binding protein [Nitrospirota bacterium]
MSESKKLPDKIQESDDGQILFSVPFPADLNAEALQALKGMQPIIIKQPYSIDYIHSYGQDSPFFAGLASRALLGCRDLETGYTYANPRAHDMYSGQPTEWVQLPEQGRVHAFTVCHFGSEEFLPQTPFVLVLVEFDGTDTLLLSRLVGLSPDEASLEWIGMPIRARFLRNSKFKPTDVYFTPLE